MSRPARLLSVVTTAALAVATLSVATSGGAQGAATDSRGAAVDRLRADSPGSLKIVRSKAGDVTFVGTAAGKRVDNPSVQPSTSVSAAAAAHLSRYGAALGTKRDGTTLREHRVLTTEVGNTVRYQQEVGGIPVLGGDVVVSLGQDRELTSMLSTMSTATTVAAAKQSLAKAESVARLVAGKDRAAAASVTSKGRWLLDPAVIGMPSKLGARGVWRLAVNAGLDVNKDVFVDDQTGAVLLAVDNNHEADRVVCDLANVPLPNGSQPPCTGGFVRTEGSPASGIADADNVYTFVGATSDLYQSIGIDLTALIGKTLSGVPKIASTVRLCYVSCPYANAFWNGTEMFYGTGLTVDDVTGHELSHGVTDRNSELLYWGQSGAINESFSDIIGEIVDHRTATPGDDPNDWQLAEESSLGAIRNLADPTIKNDPDRTQSPLYVSDLGNGAFYGDNGGVHSNSGVSNKTAYLIMKGGSFNSQTITGIDGGGDTFPKTARLYMLVNQSMSSGADFADLGNVLVQSCNALVGTFGFTATDCTNVQKATLATELAQSPANSVQPADAPTTCPAGTSRIVLFDSETGTPASKFASAAANWSRSEDPYWGSNAHSGQDSWNNATPINGAGMTPTTETLVTANPIAIPATGSTYLAFQGWYFLDFTISQPSGSITGRWDGATVEVDDVGDPAAPVDVASQPWVNGPDAVINSGSGNPAANRLAFTDDSRGWVRSRLDLGSFKGKSIKPQFSVNYDDSFTYVGWFIDDVQVYTCQVLKVTAGTVTIKGKELVGKRLKARTAGWLPVDTTFTYKWLRNGKVIKGATARRYKTTSKDLGKKLSVRVTGVRAGYASATVTSAKTGKIKNP